MWTLLHRQRRLACICVKASKSFSPHCSGYVENQTELRVENIATIWVCLYWRPQSDQHRMCDAHPIIGGVSNRETRSLVHVYLDWVKGRLDEVDATLASADGYTAKLYGDARAKADRAVAGMHQARDAFGKFMIEQAESGQETLARSKKAADNQWALFERSFQDYVEAAGKQADVERAAFEARAAAQGKAWQEAIDKLHKSATAFAADRRADLDKTVTQMKTQADAAKLKFDKLYEAKGESWVALKTALSESRAALDRAYQAAQEAFKRAS